MGLPVEPRCPHVGRCGGCQLQHLSYPDQLSHKTASLQHELRALAPGIDLDVIGAPEAWRYRNKSELTFSAEGGAVTLGYHAAKSFWRIVDIDECLLLPEPINAVMNTIRRLARGTGRPAYDQRRHDGFFRHALIRQSRATRQVMVCLVTGAGELEMMEAMAGGLMAEHAEVASVYWGVSGKLADVAFPDELRLLRGAPHLAEQVGPFTVQLQPFTFLQPNLAQAERLYETVIGWLAPEPHGTAWDCYCGVGLVGLYLSKRFGRVYGIDSEACNIESARANAAANGVDTLQWRAGRTEEVFADKRFWLLKAAPDAVVVDPPRAGLHAQVISTLLAAHPRQLVYISCNPQALARDLEILLRGFPRYSVRRASAFDLFPQTPHVETAVLLER